MDWKDSLLVALFLSFITLSGGALYWAGNTNTDVRVLKKEHEALIGLVKTAQNNSNKIKNIEDNMIEVKDSLIRVEDKVDRGFDAINQNFIDYFATE